MIIFFGLQFLYGIVSSFVFGWCYTEFEFIKNWSPTRYYFSKGRLTFIGYIFKLILLLPGYLIFILLSNIRKMFIKDDN